MDRIPASGRTRERLKALMGGDLRSALVGLAIEEGLELKPRTRGDGKYFGAARPRVPAIAMATARDD